jgi:hypothetical protein
VHKKQGLKGFLYVSNDVCIITNTDVAIQLCVEENCTAAFGMMKNTVMHMK